MNKPCRNFAPDTLGDDPDVCTTCLYSRRFHSPAQTLQHAIRHIREEYGSVVRCHDGRGDVIHYNDPAHWDAFVILQQAKCEVSNVA